MVTPDFQRDGHRHHIDIEKVHDYMWAGTNRMGLTTGLARELSKVFGIREENVTRMFTRMCNEGRMERVGWRSGVGKGSNHRSYRITDPTVWRAAQLE